MAGAESLIGVLGLAVASGVNLYATVLLLGLAARFDWFSFLPAEFEVLGNPVVLGVAAVFYTLEFFADKVPFLSTVWDGVHTFIRPLGAALLAMGVLEGQEPAVQLAAMLVAGSVALGSHTTKAGARILAHTAPEPTTHSIISVVEDLGVFGLVALLYTYPWAALAVTASILAIMAAVTPRLLRTLRFLIQSMIGVVRSWAGGRPTEGVSPPAWLAERLRSLDADTSWRVFPAWSRTLPGFPRLGGGFLAVSDHRICFGRKGLFRVRFADLGAPADFEMQPGLLCDVLVKRGESSRICLTDDWSRALEQSAVLLR